MFELRKQSSWIASAACSVICVVCCFLLWDFITRGEYDTRIVSPAVMPSPWETFASFHSLWFDRCLTLNTFASLKRVAIGFCLASVIGVPLGILCGCFGWANAFFMPLSIFGRNIPVAALVPVTFALFGIGEQQKIAFIFIATVAFIWADTSRSISDISQRYVDTALTLGASKWQVIKKVLVPLSLPSIFNSLRLLFGLAFGYIMLAELVKFGSESGGLGDIIITSQRRGPKEHIWLVLLIIPVIALVIDRVLLMAQKQIFPYLYGGSGILHRITLGILHFGEDVKNFFKGAK